MNSLSISRRAVASLALVVCLLFVGTASWAQDNKPAPADDKTPPKAQTAEKKRASATSEESAGATDTRAKKSGGRVYGPPLMGREVWQLKKLHRLLDETVDPTPEQKKNWDMLFDNYVKQMKAGMETPGQFTGTTQDVPGMSERGGRVYPPGSANDRAQKALSAVTRQKYGGLAHPLSTHHVLASDAMDSMTLAQREKFEPEYFRWNVLRPKSVEDGPLARLSRGLRDPKLKLEDEERAKLRTIVKKYMDEVKKSRRDKDKVQQAYEGAKAEVLEGLDEPNATQLRATLKELDHDLENWTRESEEYRRELAERAGQ